MTWLGAIVLAASLALQYYWGFRNGLRRGRSEAVDVLTGFLQNVAWSGSVRDCARLLEGKTTVAELRAEREKRP